MEGMERMEGAAQGGAINRQTFSLPVDLISKVEKTLEDWRAGGKVQRLWAGDASLWTGADEGGWLGWLGLPGEMRKEAALLREAGEDVRAGGFTHALLMGMGGSSLCPEVLKATFGRRAGFPDLYVLDSTDPARVRALEERVDLSRTLFIVSSKSGTTLEPNIFFEYFFERAARAAGGPPGDRFIAVTDPGSKLEEIAGREGFRRVFHGLPSVGGRYSALSNFGMAPAAVMGIDAARFLESAEEMARACGADRPPAENPGVALGVLLGVLAGEGRDKVTLIVSPGIAGLGAWLEQLLAESTGKAGKGLIPVDGERPGPPGAYGADRLFVHLRLEGALDPAQDAAVLALERAGAPLVRISVADPYDLGQEFFRWEIATATAGAVMGVNPFDQPDVEASKAAARELTSAYEREGALPEETPIAEEGGIRLFAEGESAAALGGETSLAGLLGAHLSRAGAGDYIALLAYLEMSEANAARLQAVRRLLRDKLGVATCLGFGPRFLHSTGQVYKGGPDSGVFLQITCEDAEDLPVPGRRCTFGAVKAAQALGDFRVLAERGRRALR
ncbi:MAG: bifunctional transaldolase/phosoglucose isomerase, partial [bacterium]